ncbi:MAG: hypothetical protein ACJAQT_004988, partial [Akkermansiaceae bacterium]
LGVRVGLVVEPFVEVDAEDSVEKEVGGAFVRFAGSSDESDGADGGGAAVGVGAVVAEEVSDAEHAVTFECFFEHLLVAGLEDVQGHSSVGEEDGIGQEHDSAFFWDFERVHCLERREFDHRKSRIKQKLG